MEEILQLACKQVMNDTCEKKKQLVIIQIYKYLETINKQKTYQVVGGISLGMFFVRQGALKLVVQFFPNIPPTTVRGKPTKQNIFKIHT